MKVNIIGSGNVATHLAKNLFKNGINIDCVFSRSSSHAQQLASEINSNFTNNIDLLNPEVDINIIAINDAAIKETATKLPFSTPVVHTSGGINVDVFSKFNNFGIIYPLQTFSKNAHMDLKKVHFLVEGSNKEFEQLIFTFVSQKLSDSVSVTSSHERKLIHLSAVITSNFMTYLLAVAEEALNSHQISLEVLKPLINETIRKSFMNGPKKSLTGPAVRGDQELISEYSKMIVDVNFNKAFKILNEGITKKKFKVL